MKTEELIELYKYFQKSGLRSDHAPFLVIAYAIGLVANNISTLFSSLTNETNKEK